MDTSLFLAARKGNVEALRKLLQDDPLLLEHTTISSTHTPLHIASMLGHLDFVKELIKCKTNIANYVKELDQHGFGAIHLACANGHHEVVRELLEVNDELCNLRGKDGMTPLHCACIKGRVETISHLLSVSSATISEITVRKETAPHLAVKNNQFQALEILVEGLKRNNLLEVLNSKDEEGDTFLHLAAARRNRQAITLLIECNISNPGTLQVNAMNESRLTALDLVMLFPCDSSCDDIERLLKQAGAERGRFLNDNTHSPQPPQNQVLSQSQQPTHSPQPPQNQVPSQSQQPTRSPSTNPSQEEIVDWTDYFKFKFDRSNPDRVRSDLLVVAVLLATATYQACLSPPGGFNDSGADKGTAVLAANPVSFICFIFFNTLGFIVSTNTIGVLTDKFPLHRELQVALFAMGVTYGTAMITMTPQGTIRKVVLPFYFLSIILVLTASYTTRRWYKRRRSRGLADRRRQNV